ncbi:hypothetical protein NDU88_000955 [Pleurodeles waltl]|uniref:Uncharacterized protein n=1 Tax=Pleurodeles waltl TaxID=8319 RepID=A0AAV7MNI2_PLEWA|nr:hypothetical protein NDU88_000955 [Pleurodeles waltl]
MLRLLRGWPVAARAQGEGPAPPGRRVLRRRGQERRLSWDAAAAEAVFQCRGSATGASSQQRPFRAHSASAPGSTSRTPEPLGRDWRKLRAPEPLGRDWCRPRAPEPRSRGWRRLRTPEPLGRDWRSWAHLKHIAGIGAGCPHLQHGTEIGACWCT